jgi:hypothetical protein
MAIYVRQSARNDSIFSIPQELREFKPLAARSSSKHIAGQINLAEKSFFD